MCIGLPMQIIESGFGYARCEGQGMQREVDTLLIGDQPAGTWVLVFLNTAREVISEQDAQKIGAAVSAVEMVMSTAPGISQQGMEKASIDALFADLVDREPPKPPSLVALEQQKKQLTEREN